VDELARRVRPALEASPEIAAAWVFGSVARGEARPESDVDVAVLLRTPRATAADHHREILDLAARLEGASGRRVDLLVLGLHDPIVVHRVLSEGVLVYDADPDRRLDFTTDALARYLDWAPRFEAAANKSLAANLAWARGGGG
jgi:predicted nucleotidyltransferase